MELLTLTSISKHLTEDVIDKVFKFKTNSDDTIKSIEVNTAAAAGEGMISAVYRIKVTGNKYTANFIAKGLVNDTLLRKSLKCVNFFKKEALFFTKILPVLIENQKTLGATERIQSNLPVCYGCHIDGKDDYIIMEDLSEKGFKSISEYPTKYQRNMTLQVLAHFHSASLALRIKKPDVFAKITNGLNETYYNAENRNWFAKYLQNAIKIDLNVLAELEGTDSIYYKKFEELIKEDVYGELIRLATERGEHPILNHGDAWCPNFLCNNEKAVTLDFQLVRCASLATDVAYFIILCSNLCRNKADFLEAVDIYYNALVYYLEDMNIDAKKMFCFETLNVELKKYGKFGLLAALTSIPLLASERYDILQPFEVKYSGFDRVPLDKIWHLSPIESKEDKIRLVNAVRVAVDVGFI